MGTRKSDPEGQDLKAGRGRPLSYDTKDPISGTGFGRRHGGGKCGGKGDDKKRR